MTLQCPFPLCFLFLTVFLFSVFVNHKKAFHMIEWCHQGDVHNKLKPKRNKYKSTAVWLLEIVVRKINKSARGIYYYCNNTFPLYLFKISSEVCPPQPVTKPRRPEVSTIHTPDGLGLNPVHNFSDINSFQIHLNISLYYYLSSNGT